MRIPDYKKRAALAAENWNRLQSKKDESDESTNSKEDVLFSLEDKDIEQTVSELIDDMVVPKTAVKGIQVVNKKEGNEGKLHKIA